VKKSITVVGEINTGHFGDLELAFEAINGAKDAGLDVIKFQSWAPESLFTQRHLLQNRIEAGLYKKFALDSSKLRDIAEYCSNVGIGFSSTPYSNDEVDQLAQIPNLAFIKVASMDLTNYPFLDHICQTELPIVLSTGMGSQIEISRSIERVLSKTKQPLTVLHCTSLYPTDDSVANLSNITMLKDSFPDVNVGFSDHTLGIEAGVAAASLGATLLEKHFTTNKTKIGFDNAMALSLTEIEAYVTAARRAVSLLGVYERELTSAEEEQKEKMRRSAFLKRPVAAGEPLTQELIEFKRPGTGLDPSAIEPLLGRVFNVSLQEGDQLIAEHLSN
jgi:sialic acid synthase SpsE